MLLQGESSDTTPQYGDLRYVAMRLRTLKETIRVLAMWKAKDDSHGELSSSYSKLLINSLTFPPSNLHASTPLAAFFGSASQTPALSTSPR